MRLVIKCFVCILLLSGAASFVSAEEKVIYIDVRGEAKFEVFYSRSTSTATGAVLGGLIGAGIQAGVESSNDNAKIKQIEPHIDKSAWQSDFLDTMNDNFEQKGFIAKWLDAGEVPEDGVILRIYPEHYGLTIVDSSAMLMSAYIEFKAALANAESASKKEEKKVVYITSKQKRTFETYLADKETLNADLKSALSKAAKRISNKIIYSNKV